jgi:hypothetical protein
MNPLKIKYARTEELAILFQKEYESLGNVSVSKEYILKSESMLFYNREKLIGGVIINSGLHHPLRYLKVIKSKQDRTNLLKIDSIEEKDLMEVSCIFHERNISTFERLLFFISIFQKTYYYAHLWQKIGILGGSVISKIQRIQMRLMRHIIFRATINHKLTLFGEHKGVLILYYCRKDEFILASINVLWSDILRKIFDQKSKNIS